MSSDVIVAPITAMGAGGVAIIRLSGSDCLSIVEPFLDINKNKYPLLSHYFYYSHFIASSGQLIDEVMVVFMSAPRTYTREDVVEIQCHGGTIVVRKIIDCLLAAGSRLAQPGEFTKRAFLNGRIDLSEAQAIADLISSRSDAAASIAIRQLSGSLSSKIYGYKDTVVDMLSLVEAYIDFPEDDIAAPQLDILLNRLNSLQENIEQLISTFEEGRLLRDGVSVLILGKPNVGKSSLLNYFLGENRAIVTDIPGTTRDLIEENLVLGGIPLRIIDSAGIRKSDDPIEIDGVRRAIGKVASADLVIYMIDGSCPERFDVASEFQMLAGKRVIVVVNKADVSGASVPDCVSSYNPIFISLKSGAGVDQLKNAILCVFDVSGEVSETVMLSDRRHRHSLSKALAALIEFKGEIKSGASPEFLSIHLRDVLSALGDITGETTADDVLNNIFSNFCIGK